LAAISPGFIMTKFTAIALWPLVYILDALSYFLGFQTFGEARKTSNKLFKQLTHQDNSLFGKSSNSSILID
jgi:hypothetical protein